MFVQTRTSFSFVITPTQVEPRPPQTPPLDQSQEFLSVNDTSAILGDNGCDVKSHDFGIAKPDPTKPKTPTPDQPRGNRLDFDPIRPETPPLGQPQG
ncbi:uncharacterized protein Z518_03160 [Rhinocladiella mackenziei CBS 650.93]|uniref:Uncharacterized protein n=1 Tax=Rhinocladiella mackenziei CBS 650.93 TaxID=1442369 RepID=A0A0D2IRD7_9EURO|nr:uncharacterized protein Z518_03160 [Rhinocladiella mackenziei CBS 650.93]KIX08504.1 hypothetical protein Z518_03160 [Rhinocladiella mackenziei CBS 650.93]